MMQTGTWLFIMENCSYNDTADAEFNATSNYSMVDAWLINGTGTDGIQIPASGDYGHFRVYACNNNSECAYSDNFSYYYTLLGDPQYQPPTITLESPINSYLSRDGNITDGYFQVKWQSNDGLGTEGNVTLWMNFTTNSSTDPNNPDYNNTLIGDVNVTFIQNATLNSQGNFTGSSYELYNFSLDTIFAETGLISDEILVWWTAVGCNTNATMPGNCSWAQGNFSLTTDFPDPDTTLPTVDLVSPANGTVSNGSTNFIIDVADNVDISNITLYWRHTATYPGGNNETGEVVTNLLKNDTLDLSNFMLNGTTYRGQFNMTGLLNNLSGNWDDNASFHRWRRWFHYLEY